MGPEAECGYPSKKVDRLLLEQMYKSDFNGQHRTETAVYHNMGIDSSCIRSTHPAFGVLIDKATDQHQPFMTTRSRLPHLDNCPKRCAQNASFPSSSYSLPPALHVQGQYSEDTRHVEHGLRHIKGLKAITKPNCEPRQSFFCAMLGPAGADLCRRLHKTFVSTPS